MIRPRLRIPRVPRFGGLARPCTTPFPFLPVTGSPRSLHTVPELPNFLDLNKDWLLSEMGIQIGWRDYQNMLLHKLNAITSGTEFEAAELKATLIATARDPETAHVFNYASAAHNNHFFFQHLAPEPVDMPETLKTQLETSFGSIETLRLEMINTANAMFGPGFVWLVRTSPRGGFPSFKVLPTYLAGSPYSGAHWRRQDVDLNTAVGSTDAGVETARGYLDDTAYGQGRGSAAAQRRKEIAPGGIDVWPVLGLSVWEHTYLADYGVHGKLPFAEKWWQFIDWEKVRVQSEVGSSAMRP